MAQGAVLDARAAILRLVTNQATELSVGHKTKASLPGIQFLQPILLRPAHKIKPFPCGSEESGRKRQGTGGGAEGTPAAGAPRAFRTGRACKSAMIPAPGEVKTHENPSSRNPPRRHGRPATRSEGRGPSQASSGNAPVTFAPSRGSFIFLSGSSVLQCCGLRPTECYDGPLARCSTTWRVGDGSEQRKSAPKTRTAAARDVSRAAAPQLPAVF